jgi:hypothetical protein
MVFYIDGVMCKIKEVYGDEGHPDKPSSEILPGIPDVAVVIEIQKGLLDLKKFNEKLKKELVVSIKVLSNEN